MTAPAAVRDGLTVERLVRGMAARFRQAGLQTPELDARLLTAQALGLDAARLIAEASAAVPENRRALSDRLAARRLAGEPVARIIGRKGFWTLELEIGPSVLDPRPDTETVVGAALAHLDRQAPFRIVDLGTGSGALLLALLSECPAATGIGIDRSPAALKIARANAKRAGLEKRTSFFCGDWTAALAGGVDLIVSNPPYIRSADIAGLAPEVRDFDPLLALDGGEDGLDAYRAIFRDAGRVLASRGLIVVEVGEKMADDVSSIADAAGFDVVDRRSDLGGVVRALVLRADHKKLLGTKPLKG